MTITYTLEPEDLVARDKFTVTRGQWKKRYLGPILIVSLLIAGTVIYTVFQGASTSPALRELGVQALMGLGAFGVAALWVTLRRRYYYHHTFKQASSDAYAPTTVTLLPEGVITAGMFDSSTLKWPAFKGTGQDNRCIYLWCLDNSDEMLVIPKRAFVSGADAAEFFRLAERYRSAAAQSAPAGAGRG